MRDACRMSGVAAALRRKPGARRQTKAEVAFRAARL
jgi:hypothetical protein